MALTNISPQERGGNWGYRPVEPDTGGLLPIPTELPPQGGRATPDTADEEEPATPATGGAVSSDAQLMAPVMKAKVNSAAAHAAHAQPYLASDPRFAGFNAALDAGDGNAAMAEAQKLIGQLASQKPPDPQLLGEARMALAAGAMMAGKLDEAKKALVSIPPKSLDPAERQQCAELRNLLKDAYRGLFSKSFQADTAPDAQAKDRGKDAADQARNLLDLLEKTEPGNQAEIEETRLKLANAQLLGGHYQEAEKSVAGIDQKRLAPDQAEYLGAIRQEIQAQQIGALGAAYHRDMRRGYYAEASENATARVNDIQKYFPDAREALVEARLDQANVQLLNGDIKGARASLSQIAQKDLVAAPREIRQRQKDLNKQVEETAKNKAEQAETKHRLENIKRLVTYGDRDTKKEAVGEAEQLLSEMQARHPENTKVIESTKLAVADIKLAAGDARGAAASAKEVAASTEDPETKDRATLLEAQALSSGKPPQNGQAAKVLHSLMESGATAEFRDEAKKMLISMETDFVNDIDRKAGTEIDSLNKLKNKNYPPDYFGKLHDFDDYGVYIQKPHDAKIQELKDISKGAQLVATAMKANGVTVEELEKMDEHRLAALSGINGEADAKLLRKTLNMGDVEVIARNDFQGNQFSWDKGSCYVDPSYLDTPTQAAAKWIGNQVRAARAEEEALSHDHSRGWRLYGQIAGGILDGISAADNFLKNTVKTSYEFYQHKGGILGKVGEGATFLVDAAASTVTMPATVIDYKATDEERAGAIQGTFLLAASAGLLKAGGPGLKQALGTAGRTIANSRLAQRVAESWVGDAARWSATKFENSAFAKGVDRLYETVGKVTRFGRARVSGGGGEGAGGVGGDAAAGAKAAADDAFDAAETLKMPRAGEGQAPKTWNAAEADAADTLDMPAGTDQAWDTLVMDTDPIAAQARSLPQVVGDVVGDKTAGEIRDSITPKQIKAVEGRLIKDEYKKMIAERKRELRKAGLKPTDDQVKDILRQQYPGDSLRDVLRQRMRSEFSEHDVQRLALGKRIYKEAYHSEVEDKPAHITQREYQEDLDMAKGPQVDLNRWDSPDGKTRIREDENWHHRFSKNGGEIGLDIKKLRSGEDIRRFYFNVKPDSAAGLSDFLDSKLNAATNNGQRIRWQYKVAREIEGFDRPDSAVLYVNKADYETVKKIVTEYAEQHPEAFADGTPSLTKPLEPGVAAAEEPLQPGLPKNRSRQHSFGSSRCDIIAEAILNAPPEATKDQILALVRERMKAYNLDPDRPWLSRPGDADDL